jgi:opacity protein-like surface antigen
MPNAAIAAVLLAIAWPASAQTPRLPSAVRTRDSTSILATRTGHEVRVTLGHYTYIEPGALRISIRGLKFGGDYTGTFAFTRRPHWFAQANVRGRAGRVSYDGWCRPYLIRPNPGSPNGYELGLGAASPCAEADDPDGYLEGRGLIGKDVIADHWGFSPATGLGIRYLSDGLTGVAGYRTDAYLYLPLGLTMRTAVASHGVVSVNGEFDALLHGWQTTRQSRLAGGRVPATETTPAFTIDRFTDLSFPQSGGWALRGGVQYQVSRHWSIEPSYIHWHVGASPVKAATVAFAVNRVTAQEEWDAYEPVNVTHEWAVNLGFHF